MIQVKVARCGYCGACVGVCPVGAITAGDTSADALASYEERWLVRRGRKMARNYRLKERFQPDEF